MGSRDKPALASAGSAASRRSPRRDQLSAPPAGSVARSIVERGTWPEPGDRLSMRELHRGQTWLEMPEEPQQAFDLAQLAAELRSLTERQQNTQAQEERRRAATLECIASSRTGSVHSLRRSKRVCLRSGSMGRLERPETGWVLSGRGSSAARGLRVRRVERRGPRRWCRSNPLGGEPHASRYRGSAGAGTDDARQ